MPRTHEGLPLLGEVTIQLRSDVVLMLLVVLSTQFTVPLKDSGSDATLSTSGPSSHSGSLATLASAPKPSLREGSQVEQKARRDSERYRPAIAGAGVRLEDVRRHLTTTSCDR